MVYESFKDLLRKRASDKVLLAEVFDIAKDLKYDGYQCGIDSMIYKFFDKWSAGTSTHT